ncbi:hypothetical protein LPB140_08280 [Sphingorhabdus lutea]|uniref:CheW-like domain-containing protein n=1 Tax=Sphingorhabdus lutea TaxID=1913578 RepID=A0A1L3JCC2_9SPHN|nr:chemotaxis protein CheW [Sphingorhabdus lutea]APG62785.1 hypothetical protein LPB140_08280 [Sphingorhabdus lutea]
MENNLYLIAQIGESYVAISSAHVESVVHIQNITAIPRVTPLVAGLVSLRSQVLTLIDTQYLITGEAQQVKIGALAIAATIMGHPYGLLVDHVNDVIEITKDKIINDFTIRGQWADYCNAIAELDDKMILIIDPSALVSQRNSIAA